MYSRRCEKKGWYWAHVTNRLWAVWACKADQLTAIYPLCDYHLPSRLKSWVWNGDLSLANRIVLKRSVFTASLPTPPRTYGRCKRGCSHGNCDSESDDLGNEGSAFSSTDEDAQFQRLCIKRRRSLSKGDDKEVLWSAGPKSEVECQKDLDEDYRQRLTFHQLLRRQLLRCCIASYEAVTRLVVGWHLRHFITSLNCGLWQLHLFAFPSFLRLPRPASPHKTRVDSQKASYRRTFYMAPGSPSSHESSNSWYRP